MRATARELISAAALAVVLLGCDFLIAGPRFSAMERIERALSEAGLASVTALHLEAQGSSPPGRAELERTGRTIARGVFPRDVLIPQQGELALAACYLLPLLSARYTLTYDGATPDRMFATDDRGLTARLHWDGDDPLPSEIELFDPADGTVAATIRARDAGGGWRELELAAVERRWKVALRPL